MKRTLFLAALSCTLAASSLAAAQTATFEWLDQAFSADDMSPNGQWVVGGSFTGGYIWSLETGYTFIGGQNAVAVSDDGSVVFGQIEDPENPGHLVAAVWTSESGWESLGGLPGGGLCPSVSSAYELSADGSVGVGLGWVDGCNGSAFRWTPEGGMVGLELLANGSNRASVVSADGQLMGGFAQGSFSRTPAIWHADGTGELLDPPDGDVLGEVHGMSDDGSVLLGNWEGQAFYRTEEEGVVTFDGGIPSWTGIAMDIADSGTIVGFDILLTSRKAWIRMPGEDAQDLRSYIVSLGAEGVPSNLQVAQAISTDGTVIIGHNAFSNGWIIRISDGCAEDVTGDSVVDILDLLAVLADWGPCVGCPADVNGDDVVDILDLLAVLGAWGPCP